MSSAYSVCWIAGSIVLHLPLSLAQEPFADPGNGAWDSRFSRGLGEVHVLRELPDGSVLAGGRLLVAPGPDRAQHTILRWRPETGWAPVAHGLSFPSLPATVFRDVLEYRESVYLAGTMTWQGDGIPVRNLLRWSNGVWSGLGDGIEGTPACLIEHKGRLYVGGTLQRAGGHAVRNIASWDGEAWSPVGTGVPFPILALATYGGDLIAAGDASDPAGPGGLLRWDGHDWQPFEGGGLGPAEPAHFVSVLRALGTELFVAGRFTLAGDTPVQNIARWDGVRWHALGDGIGPGVATATALHAFEGELVAAGTFRVAGDLAASGLASWNGTRWRPWTGHSYAQFTSMVRAGDDLMGLGFSTNAFCGGRRTVALVRETGSVFQGLGYSGPEAPGIPAVVATPESLLVGGRFYPDGASLWNCVAAWNGTTWGELGSGLGIPRSGVTAEILAVANAGPHHAIGGRFSRIRDLTANHVAHWDGASWQPLGEGLPGPVSALAWQGDRLIAAGAPFGVAVWNGRSWSSPGLAPDLTVQSLAVDGHQLFAAGFRPDTPPTNRLGAVFRWNGFEWTVLADGIRSGVLTLHHDGERLFLGGRFTRIGDIEASGVAMWNGHAWSAVGSRLIEMPFSVVNAIATDGRGRVFLAGDFIAQPSEATRVAYLEAGQWQRMGSGVWPTIPTALAWWRGAAYIGGSFIQAGDSSSFGIARWADPHGDFELAPMVPQSVAPGAEFEVELLAHRVAGLGPAAAEILLPLPDGVSFVAADGGGSIQDRTVRWTLALPAAESLRVSCRLTAPTEPTLLAFRGVRIVAGNATPFVSRVETTRVAPDVAPPEVRIVAPEGGTQWIGDPLVIQAVCNPGASGIVSVSFHLGDRTLATRASEPWSIEWTPTETGTALLRAACTDASGTTLHSLPVRVAIRARPANDTFASRLPITGYQGSFEVDPRDASAEEGEPDHGLGMPHRSVWWAFHPTLAGRLFIERGHPDTPVGIYRGGSVDTLVRVAPSPHGDHHDLESDTGYSIAFDAPDHVQSFVWSFRWIPAGGRLVSASLDTEGHMAMRFEGFRDTPYRLEASPDLVRWDVVDTFVGEDLPNLLTVPLDCSAPARFFRVQ
ncbi:MAG: hypothetical protein KF833_05340 [Verrucomicrobiae bacterium]|nr:hypothetical protein [Verrucomicrobiae bacterium]